MSLPAPNPRAAKDAHIAQRRATLEEEIRHFAAEAKITNLGDAQKAEAEARVEVATALLEALSAL